MWCSKKYVIPFCLQTFCSVSYEVCLADSILKKHGLSKACKPVNQHKRNNNKKMPINGFSFFKPNTLESRNCGGVISSNLNTESEEEHMCEMLENFWLKGNIVSSFYQFTKLYEKGDNGLRKKLIQALQQLIYVSIEQDGKAVVTNIIFNVKKFSTEKNEWCLLMTVWYALFISKFYEDNCLASILLEDSSSFKTYLEHFIPYFGALFLKKHEVLLYQRLIITALCHKMDNAAGILLRMLFDYYYKTGYFMGCSAVYKCCIDLEIKLTRDQIYKYSVLKKISVEVKNKLLDFHRPKDFIYKF